MANNALGKASLILSTDSKDLEKGLDNAEKRIDRFSSLRPNVPTPQAPQMPQAQGGGGGMGAAMMGGAIVAGATIAVGAVVNLFETFKAKAFSIFEDIGNQAKRANILGIGAEQFQELTAGTRTDADTLTRSLGHLQRQVAELGMENRGAGRTFAQLGLRQADLQGMNTAEQFRTVADRMRALPTEADRTRVAFQLFGRSAQEMLPALREGLEPGIARARELGLILSNETVESIKQVNRAYKDIGQIQKGIWTQFAAAAVPAFLAMAQVAQSVWREIGPLFQQGAKLVSAYFNYIKAAWEEIMPRLQPVIAAMRQFFGGQDLDVHGIIGALASISQWTMQVYVIIWNATLQISRAYLTNLQAPSLQMSATVIEAFQVLIPPITSVINWMMAAFTELDRAYQRFLVAPALDASASIIGAFTQLVSPIVTVFNQLIGLGQSFLTSFTVPLLDGFLNLIAGAQATATAIANAIPEGPARTAALGLATSIGGARTAVENVRDGVRDLANLPLTLQAAPIMATLTTVQQTLRNSAAQVRALADGLEPAELNAEAIQATIQGVAEQLRQAGIDADFTAEMLAGLEIDPANVDDFFAAIMERARRAAAQVRQDFNDAIDPHLIQRAFDIGERFGRNPFETFERDFQELQQMLVLGLIDPDTFARASQDMMQRAEQAMNIRPTQMAQAMLAGSTQAANVIYQAQYGQQTANDPQERLVRLAEVGNRLAAREAVAVEQLLQVAQNNGFGLLQ